MYYINKFIMIDEDRNMDLNLILASIPVFRCSSISAAYPQTRLTVNNCLGVPQRLNPKYTKGLR